MGRDYSDNSIQRADDLNPAWTCRSCGAPLPHGARFCEMCGQPVAQAETKTWTCRSCGAVLEAGWVYCNICGAKKGELLSEPLLPSAAPGPSANPPVTSGSSAPGPSDNPPTVPGLSAVPPEDLSGLPDHPVPYLGAKPETGDLVINMKHGKASASRPDDCGKKPPALPEGGFFKEAGDL